MSEILIVNNAEPGIREFAEPIEQLISDTGSTYTFIEYTACAKTNLNEFDGVILTGSPQGDDIVEHHAPYFYWIKDFENPILGICAGHHRRKNTALSRGFRMMRLDEPSKLGRLPR